MIGEKFDIEIKGRLMEIEVTHYWPSHPAPVCRFPSGPLYADPGDPGELDFDAHWIDDDGNLIEVSDQEWGDDKFRDEVNEMASEKVDELARQEVISSAVDIAYDRMREF